MQLKDYIKYAVLGIVLLLFIKGVALDHSFMSMTVWDDKFQSSKKTIYGGDTVGITVAIYAEYYDNVKGFFIGGKYANCCDDAVVLIRVGYPDGTVDKIKIHTGMLCNPAIVGGKTTYTVLKDKGKGTMSFVAQLYCEENVNGVITSYELSPSGGKTGSTWSATYYPRNPCEGVVCEPYCEGYTWYGDGECVPSGESYWCYYHTVEENSPKCGWKDSDGDGVPDWEDECPNQAGPAKFNGCPDSDGDGIPDNKDACPNEYGEAKYDGCPPPDSDGDGIPDDVDKCPYQPGLPQFDGCPDSDGDGIPDNEDACPYEPGVPEEHGCPPKNVTTIAAPTPSENVTAPSPTEVSPPPEEVTPTPGVVRPSAPYVPPSGAYEEEEVKRPVCGNGICEPGENILNCPKDCLSKATVINAVLVAIVVILVIVILLRK